MKVYVVTNNERRWQEKFIYKYYCISIVILILRVKIIHVDRVSNKPKFAFIAQANSYIIRLN